MTQIAIEYSLRGKTPDNTRNKTGLVMAHALVTNI